MISLCVCCTHDLKSPFMNCWFSQPQCLCSLPVFHLRRSIIFVVDSPLVCTGITVEPWAAVLCHAKIPPSPLASRSDHGTAGSGHWECQPNKTWRAASPLPQHRQERIVLPLKSSKFRAWMDLTCLRSLSAILGRLAKKSITWPTCPRKHRRLKA